MTDVSARDAAVRAVAEARCPNVHTGHTNEATERLGPLRTWLTCGDVLLAERTWHEASRGEDVRQWFDAVLDRHHIDTWPAVAIAALATSADVRAGLVAVGVKAAVRWTGDADDAKTGQLVVDAVPAALGGAG